MGADNQPAHCERASISLRGIAAAFASAGIAITIFDAMLMAKGAMLMAPDSSSVNLFFAGEGTYIMAGIAVCGAIVKAGWMAAAREFLRRRIWFVALIVTMLGLFLHLFSMTATIGLAAAGRDATVSARTHAQDNHSRVQAAYDDARRRKLAAPATRPVALVHAELTDAENAVAEYKRREDTERATICGQRCNDAVQKGDAAKLRRDGLKSELAIALEAAKADADLAEAEQRLAAIRAPEKRDPQAEVLAAYLPWSAATVDRVALLLPLLPSLVVELGGPVCFLVAGAFLGFAQGGAGVNRQRSKAGPAQDMSAPRPKRVRTNVVALVPSLMDMAKRGMSERQIADALGMSKSAVHRQLVQGRGKIAVRTAMTRA